MRSRVALPGPFKLKESEERNVSLHIMATDTLFPIFSSPPSETYYLMTKGWHIGEMCGDVTKSAAVAWMAFLAAFLFASH